MAESLPDWKTIALVGMFAAGGAGGGTFVHNKVSPPRPDPFTSVDAKSMKEAILAEIKLELLTLELNIRQDMPPIHTRNRILELEQWVRKQDPDWDPPSTRWNN